ncbi:E3 ubiquitin/ISG15 ligase TRIM25 [Bagarius yarrelli]|uniref:E3 ubiquitin/ISG15 ligase TRIM25 n=1 Tax=Bagarius yarrelli TaxID=175774 RepID=A0A556VUP9_BAGYA|nr:E3 ubiquitin/ISG15 ligase TRIM25 [Bagarius yarrelli]
MSIPVDFLSEEQFSCSICLDIFTNPVSTPCGHSFCLACIMSYWDGQAKTCLCPLCKESFRKRPELHINHTLKEITEQFKRMAEGSGTSIISGAAQAASSQSPRMVDRNIRSSRPGELPVVLLKEMKSRFQRTSSSGNLLEALAPSSPPSPYEASRRRFSASGFGPASSGSLCSKHGLSLDMFCKNDQMCVCAMCSEGDHHDHTLVVARREMTVKKANAQQEVEITVSMFRSLISSLERSQAEALEVVEMGRAAAEHRSQALIRDLQLEISELRKRSSTLSQLSQSNNHLSFFKMYPSVSPAPSMKSWTDVTLTPEPTAGVVLKTVTQMTEDEVLSESGEETQQDKILTAVAEPDGVYLVKAGFLKIQHKYEIIFFIPHVPTLGKDTSLSPALRTTPKPRLRATRIAPRPEGMFLCAAAAVTTQTNKNFKLFDFLTVTVSPAAVRFLSFLVTQDLYSCLIINEISEKKKLNVIFIIKYSVSYSHCKINSLEKGSVKVNVTLFFVDVIPSSRDIKNTLVSAKENNSTNLPVVNGSVLAGELIIFYLQFF